MERGFEAGALGYVMKCAGERRAAAGRPLGAARRTSCQRGIVPRWRERKTLRGSMSVLSLSSRPPPESELELITQLAVTLSGLLTRVHLDESDRRLPPRSSMWLEHPCRLLPAHRVQRVGHRGRAHLPTQHANTGTGAPRPTLRCVDHRASRARRGRGRLAAGRLPGKPWLPVSSVVALRCWECRHRSRAGSSARS